MKERSHWGAIFLLVLLPGVILAWAGSALGLAPWVFRLESPLHCEPATSCYVMNYVDHDQGPGARDFLGGGLTYNGHNGTDFRVPLEAMRAGFPVLAASAGRVSRVVSWEPDATPEAVAQRTDTSDRHKFQPNVVLLDHGGGWETEYAHLRQGSVRVSPGQDVEAGQVLGLVGLSGWTSFPHLHFEVRFQGRPVDPFVGLTVDWPGQVKGPLWTPAALAAWPTGLVRELSSGFSEAVPDVKAMLWGVDHPASAHPTGKALVYWIRLLGPWRGDEVAISLLGPAGQVMGVRQNRYDHSGPVAAEYVGMALEGVPAWPPGNYTGHWVLRRTDLHGHTREFRGQHSLEMPEVDTTLGVGPGQKKAGKMR